jgi:hypothetical protein
LRLSYGAMRGSVRRLRPASGAMRPSLAATAASIRRLRPSLAATAASIRRLRPSLGATAASIRCLRPSLGATAASVRALAPFFGATGGSIRCANTSVRARPPSVSGFDAAHAPKGAALHVAGASLLAEEARVLLQDASFRVKRARSRHAESHDRVNHDTLARVKASFPWRKLIYFAAAQMRPVSPACPSSTQ